MKFDYLKQPNFRDPNKPWISRPVIPVALHYKDKRVKVFALVDSGADISLFHASLGQALGIDVTGGRKMTFFGISEGAGVEVYMHTIDLEVVGDSTSFEMEVGFTDSKGVGAILGQAGFFDHFHIKFERDKERVELTTASLH
ncbi:MAG: hypothetical protein A3A27_00785 [Candidatus Wildermuthbacteria bacterium RIFCSPLOWO2_01_FULL_47_18]|uniref:Peptidase A2 domain-containing protein n=1 Tax=Candidatus Wildermuthbacteria bacterium RIFCSPLOWO2_01_FULL_47_18 TaxID=1802460 RepID=A0A1G2RJH9_9BACT|nr:MAG: hypothetical protein A3A27_00785 [Candidatus Wildermuthbacteria bacterium RIFCSPLOWO2_01_FULL_47_18]OHB18338.1 MAG: hypothetical protein A2749_02160 [Parcubacteria group bacterium RIFCSPHIGHO2_01_FULL_45_26]